MTGEELKRIRKRLALTQAQLAERAGVASNTIARQERAEIGIGEPLARLIRLLGESAKPEPPKPAKTAGRIRKER